MTKRKWKFTIGSLFAFLVLALTIFTTGLSDRFNSVLAQQTNSNKNKTNQTQQTDTNAADRKRKFINENVEPLTPIEQAQRRLKGKRYDQRIGRTGRKQLTDLEDESGVTAARSEDERLSSLPVIESEIIAIGSIIKVQPYLTESKTAMYTEFTFHIESVLKGEQTFSEGETIQIDQEGGSMRLTNGKSVSFDIGGTGRLPEQGNRYLLFLRKINEGNDLSILTGYELRSGRVVPLKEQRVYSSDTGKIITIAPFSGIDEAEFVLAVRGAINVLPSRGGTK